MTTIDAVLGVSARSGFLDPLNPPTPTNTVALILTDGHIAANCDQCGAEADWPIADAELAAERVRAHPEFCGVGG